MADKPNQAQEEADKKNEEESKKAVINVCSLNIKQILAALHSKALEQAEKANSGKIKLTILNSAIEGNGKKANFYGAGQHIIAAIPKDAKGIDKNSVTRKDALPVLQAYVSWFVGPDLKDKVKENLLKPLEDGAGGKVADNSDKKKDIEKSKKDSVAGEKYEKGEDTAKESTIYIPSFSQYLLTEVGEDKAEDKAEGKEAREDAKSEDGKKEEEPKQEAADDGAQGWYVDYKLKVPGAKENSIADAMKKFAKDLLSNFGVQGWNFGGNTGDVHTVGDLLNDLDSIFGKMDAKKFESEFNTEMTKRMKGTSAEARVWDTKTILKYLKKEVAHDKAKIAPVEYALCVKVNKNDKSYDLFNEDTIANITNAAISGAMRGIIKKLKFGIKAKDVILVNNYQDNKKEKGEEKFDTNKAVGTVRDSLIVKNNKPLINESAKTEEKLKKDLLDIILESEFKNTKVHLNDNIASSLMNLLGLNLNIINEALLLEGHDEFYAGCLKEIDRVGAANIRDNVDKFRDEWKKIMNSMKTEKGHLVSISLPSELAKRKENSETYQKYLKKEYIKGADSTPFDKSVTSKLRKAKDDEEMRKIFTDYAGPIDTKAQEVPEFYAAFKALQKLPDKKKITVTFKYKDPTDEKAKEEEIDSIEGAAGEFKEEDYKDITDVALDADFEGYDFDGWDPDPNELTEDGDVLAQYKKDGIITVTFNDKDPTDEKAKEEEIDKLKGEPGKFNEKDYPQAKDFADYKGFEFDKWDPDPNELKDDGKVVAVYKNTTIEITFIDRDPNEKEEDKELGKVLKEEGKKIEAPEVPKHNGYEFDKWDPDPDKMTESGKTYSTYKEDKKEEKKPEENKVFTIEIVNPDPEDPENQKTQVPIATLTAYKDADGVHYESSDLSKVAKSLDDKDENKKKLEDAVKTNAEEFKKVDNVDEIAKSAPGNDQGNFKFQGWAGPDGKVGKLEELIANGPADGESSIKIKAQYDNDMKAKHTDLDFYIVPMKGLTDKEDSENKK